MRYSVTVTHETTAFATVEVEIDGEPTEAAILDALSDADLANADWRMSDGNGVRARDCSVMEDSIDQIVPPTIVTVKNSGGCWAAWYEDGSTPPGRAFGHDSEAEAVAALIDAKAQGIWVARLTDNYDGDFEQFEGFAETYGLLDRLGFESAEEAWDANPMIQGSTNPADFKVIPGTT